MTSEAMVRQRGLPPSHDPYRVNPHRVSMQIWRDIDRSWRADRIWQRISILQQEYSHEMAIFVAKWPGNDLREFRRRTPIGAPVRLNWGRRDGDHVFHGYVHHRKFESIDDDFVEAMLFCVGASMRTRNVRGKVWTGWRFDEVMREMARHSRFNHDIAKTKTRERSITQRSDEQPWAFLTRYAVAHNMTTYFHSPDLRLIVQPRSIRHLRDYRVPRVFVAAEQGGDVLSFSDREGSALPGEVLNARRTAIAMDPRSGKILTLEGERNRQPDALDEYPAMSTRVLTGLAPNGLGELREKLHAHEERASANVVQATVTLRGDARVSPVQTIYLSGVNDRDDGYWMVTSTNHVFTRDSYSMEVRVERDERTSIGPPPSTLEWYQHPYVPDEDAPRFAQADRRRAPVTLWHGKREVTGEGEDPRPPEDGLPDVREPGEDERRVRRRRATERPLLHGEWRARVSVGVGTREE